MAVPSDSPAIAHLRPQAWNRAGLIWACVNLAALAVGMFPGVLTVPESGEAAAPLPTLRAVAVAQVATLLLVYPFLLARRALRQASSVAAAGSGNTGTTGPSPSGPWPGRLFEAAAWMFVATPFLAVAAWLANATIADTVRVALLTASLFPVAWMLADFAVAGAAGVSAAGLVALLMVPGGLAANYLVWEFLPNIPADWLWYACPATMAWSTATVQQAAWLPSPIGAWLLWPAAVAGVFFARMTRRSGRSTRTKS